MLRSGGNAIETIYIFVIVMIFMLVIPRVISIKRSMERGEASEERTRVPFKEKLPTLWKPIAGIVAAVVILLINPVHDMYYYVGVIVCLVMVMWAFMDIVKRHNELTMRKLPQFNRRGGDENA